MSNARMRARTILIAIGAFALAACTGGDPISPSAVPSSPGTWNQRALKRLRLTPNSVKYREQAYAHASAHSGSVAVQARALLGKDGITRLELTTGTLGSDEAPGNIDSFQLKYLDPVNDTPLWTKSYTGLQNSGDLTISLPGLIKHFRLQVQATVSGIGSGRTVVTVTERVNLRPDLAVVAVVAPVTVRSGTGFMVAATVREVNGDVGATADCTLYIDGERDDDAHGVWVAEGDNVTCAFGVSLSRLGSRVLKVKVGNVEPDDYDGANNSGSTTVKVHNDIALRGDALVWKDDDHMFDFSAGSYTDALGAFQEYELSTDTHYRQEFATLSASAPGRLGFPITIRVTQSSGGRILSNIQETGVSGTEIDESDDSPTCAFLTGANAEDYVSVCSDGNNTWAAAGHFAAGATYLSHGFVRSFEPNGTSSETSLDAYAFTVDAGQFGDIGDDYTFDIRLQGRRNTFVMNPTVVLNEFFTTVRSSSPRACSETGIGAFAVRTCSEHRNTYTLREGVISF